MRNIYETSFVFLNETYSCLAVILWKSDYIEQIKCQILIHIGAYVQQIKHKDLYKMF